MKKALTILFVLLMLCGAANAEVFLGQPPAEGWTEDVLRITAIPVGEGDAMLLECGGETMMVDGGPSALFHQLTGALDARGITHFKYLLNTHYHDDHINGLYHLMKEGYTADEYMHPYSNIMVEGDKLEKRTVEMAKKKGITVHRLYTGDVITLGGATIRVFRHWDIPNANARSMIERVEFGDSSIWLCADITGKAQAFYAGDLPAELLKADIMKVPHHGITAVQADFMDAVNPAFCVVTNYIEGAPMTVGQMEKRGIPALYSGDGEVIMETDGHDWYVWQNLLKEE